MEGLLPCEVQDCSIQVTWSWAIQEIHPRPSEQLRIARGNSGRSWRCKAMTRTRVDCCVLLRATKQRRAVSLATMGSIPINSMHSACFEQKGSGGIPPDPPVSVAPVSIVTVADEIKQLVQMVSLDVWISWQRYSQTSLTSHDSILSSPTGSRRPQSSQWQTQVRLRALTTIVQWLRHPPFVKWLEKLAIAHINPSLPASIDPLQFAYRRNRFIANSTPLAPNSSLEHLDNKDSYISTNNVFNSRTLSKLISKLLYLYHRILNFEP